jgi:hypothetical protein
MKFCRQCGQPMDASEMTTRQLEESQPYNPMPRYDAPTQYTNSAPTSPAYMPPAAMPQQWSPPTAGMQPHSQKKPIIILVSVVGVLLIVLAGLIIYMLNQGPSARFGANIPPPPPVPSVPGQPPPPGVPGSVPAFSDLIYPGATVTMTVPGSDGKGVTNLTTHDSLDKVVDWYTARVPSAKRMILGPSTMLTYKGLVVMISGEGNETNILITRGDTN